jgi:hypothetical protein
MTKPRAFTITPLKNNPGIKVLKECYIMRHSHVSHCIWNTKVKMKLAHLDDTMRDIIDMYRDQHKIPYIPDVRKGDIVTHNHNLLLAAWAIASRAASDEKEVPDEIRGFLESK